MKIGIISDTHGYLDEAVQVHFSKCDEIWHAGDFGGLEIGSRLDAWLPTIGVYGNIDDSSLRLVYPEYQVLNRAGIAILLIHIAGSPGRYHPRVRQLIAEHQPQILVCGHSHILRVERDMKYQVVYVNPGAAGHQGMHAIRTLLILELDKAAIQDVQIIELGPRGRRQQS